MSEERAVERRHSDDQERVPPPARVRDEDLEPFAALRYIARLFKMLAVLLLLLLVAEVAIALVHTGMAALASVLVDATRLLVMAGFLWGIGDMAIMLIETNHDLRATRILVGRLQKQVEEMGRGGRLG
jgi:hypothetical protein